MSAQIVKNYKPIYWATDGQNKNTRCMVSPYSEEFKQIERDFEAEGLDIDYIQRVEDLKKYGQYLLTQQRLAVTYEDIEYYRVRKYVQVHKDDVSDAIRFNLDERRCHCTFKFKDLEDTYPDYISAILIVSVITDKKYKSKVKPTKDDEFYIEYVVHLD